MRSAQQRQPGRRRVALRVNCGQLDPGRLALLSGRFDSTVDAVDDLRQPGTTGHGRHGATHDQSLRPTSEMRRSRRLRRRETPTRPMSNEVWSVRRLPCVSYINWPANLSSAGAVRPPNEMLGAMLIIRSSASSVTWSLLHHATDHGLVYDLGSQPDIPWAAEIFITEERGTS